MVVFRELDIETDGIMIKLTKIIRKVVAYVDFAAPIILDSEHFEHRFTYETVNYTTIARDFLQN